MPHPTIRMRCMPFKSQQADKAHHNITTETLVGLPAQMPAATGVAFVCTPAAAAIVRQTACQVEPSCLTSGVVSLSFEPQWDAKGRINRWSGRWSGDALLQTDPSAICVVYYRISNGQGIDIKNLSSRSVLTVNNMTEDHFGNYTCVATNKLGMANASVSLIGEFLWFHAESEVWNV